MPAGTDKKENDEQFEKKKTLLVSVQLNTNSFAIFTLLIINDLQHA